MPSSASSSPGLSRPTTANNHNSRPVSPAVPKTNAANKRLRKEMLEDINEHDSILNVTDRSHNIVNNVVDNDISRSPAAKKAKTTHLSSKPPILNGSVKSTTKNCDTVASNGLLHHAKNNAGDKIEEIDPDDLVDTNTSRKGITTTSLMPGINTDETIPKAKKVSRKKQLEQEREHLLEQKLLTARRQASKVRTTQELVQELALRSSTPTAPVKSSSSSMMANETKTELMNRFFESQNNGNNQHSDVLSPPLSDGPPSPSNVAKYGQNLAKNNNNQNDSKESVEDILAQLPPIDVASVLAEINSEMQQNSSNHDNTDGGHTSGSDENESDQEEIEGLIPPVKKTRQNTTTTNSSSAKKQEQLSDGVKAAMVDELHAGQHESVNGNFDHDGAFKEWHEVVTKETVNGDLLYILPYSVID